MNKLKKNSPVVIQRPEANIVLFFNWALFDSESVRAPIKGVKIRSDKIGKLIL